MSSDDQKGREMSIYFGREDELRLSRSTVGDVIENEMHLTGMNGDPQWSKGVRKLLRLGMEAYRLQQMGENIGGGSAGKIEDLERQVAEYRQKIEELRSEIDNRKPDLDLIVASDRDHMSEIPILEILDRNEGVNSMYFVGIPEIAAESGLHHETVSRYVRVLSNAEQGGHVIWIERRDSTTAANPEACELQYKYHNIYPDQARAVNGPR